jgi:shikimate 5-dehydrogenase
VRSFKQELVAVFGQPVAENPTQAMIEAAFRHYGLDWRYLTIEVAPDDLGAAVAGARAMGFRGFNCTVPHKVAVVPHLDRLGTSAERVPVLLDALGVGSLVADVIPNPPRTPFLVEAEARGLETVDGLEMLVNQGVLSVEYWTGLRPDTGVMRNALIEVFGSGPRSE